MSRARRNDPTRHRTDADDHPVRNASPLGAILADRWGESASSPRPPLRADVAGATPAGDPWLGFLAGPENALAHAAVLALARGEVRGTSPLVVFGASGVGKSRLLAGLAGEWRRRGDGVSAFVSDAEGFAATCALAAHDAAGWAIRRGAMRSCGLFVLDDLLALARTPRAASELMFVLDDLESTGTPVAVAAGSPPSLWIDAGLPARLVGRLSAGLVVSVAPPGEDLRRRYTLDGARRRSLTLTAEALDAIVAASDSFPAIDGALARLALESRLGGPGATARGQAAALAAASSGLRTTGPTIESVMRAVSAHFRVPLKDLRCASRRAALVEPRHLAMYLVREWTGASFLKIGRAFGGRDTATVRHACRAAAARIAARPELAAAVEAIRLGRDRG